MPKKIQSALDLGDICTHVGVALAQAICGGDLFLCEYDAKCWVFWLPFTSTFNLFQQSSARCIRPFFFFFGTALIFPFASSAMIKANLKSVD